MRALLLCAALYAAAGCATEHDVAVERERTRQAELQAEADRSWLEHDPAAFARQVERRECRRSAFRLKYERSKSVRECGPRAADREGAKAAALAILGSELFDQHRRGHWDDESLDEALDEALAELHRRLRGRRDR